MREVHAPATDGDRPPWSSLPPYVVAEPRDWRSEAARIERRHRLELIVATVTVLALAAAFMAVQLT